MEPSASVFGRRPKFFRPSASASAKKTTFGRPLLSIRFFEAVNNKFTFMGLIKSEMKHDKKIRLQGIQVYHKNWINVFLTYFLRRNILSVIYVSEVTYFG